MDSHDSSYAGAMLGQTIGHGRYEFIELIGVGTYGEVYLTRDRCTNYLYATKCIRKADFNTKTCSYRIEIAIQRQLPVHRNIARLHFTEHWDEYVFMVMEYCPGGDLYDNIVNNPVFKGPRHNGIVRRVFLQLLSAVEHCHRHGVYHRDLKPENVLVIDNGRRIKLIDFGLATDAPCSSDIGCGSSYYMSPECQGGLDGLCASYDTAANDVWSLGVILVNLASGRNPWNQAILSDPIFRAFVNNPDFLSHALPISDQFNHIIKRVFCLDPKQRCTLSELRRMVKDCQHFMRPATEPQQQQQSEYQQHHHATSAGTVTMPSSTASNATPPSPLSATESSLETKGGQTNVVVGPAATGNMATPAASATEIFAISPCSSSAGADNVATTARSPCHREVPDDAEVDDIDLQYPFSCSVASTVCLDVTDQPQNICLHQQPSQSAGLDGDGEYVVIPTTAAAAAATHCRLASAKNGGNGESDSVAVEEDRTAFYPGPASATLAVGLPKELLDPQHCHKAKAVDGKHDAVVAAARTPRGDATVRSRYHHTAKAAGLHLDSSLMAIINGGSGGHGYKDDGSSAAMMMMGDDNNDMMGSTTPVDDGTAMPWSTAATGAPIATTTKPAGGVPPASSSPTDNFFAMKTPINNLTFDGMLYYTATAAAPTDSGTMAAATVPDQVPLRHDHCFVPMTTTLSTFMDHSMKVDAAVEADDVMLAATTSASLSLSASEDTPSHTKDDDAPVAAALARPPPMATGGGGEALAIPVNVILDDSVFTMVDMGKGHYHHHAAGGDNTATATAGVGVGFPSSAFYPAPPPQSSRPHHPASSKMIPDFGYLYSNQFIF
ncbi:Serine/threonine protein kinase [Dimargaris verticillata]|uniref:Serine/threonine protein kinase n=1 Tax=Dimargaris verticillata TaxID=2761393 RepID=A0A9W8EE24_9FUNG|nr:Serine/threonine protein kinase [Dimargaris verticillata]